MQLSGFLRICGMGLFGCSKCAYVNLLSKVFDLGSPWFFSPRPLQNNTAIPAGVICIQPGIRPVPCEITETKIADTVVAPDAIDVINMAVRPDAIVHRPSNSMTRVKDTAQLNTAISFAVEAARFLTQPLWVFCLNPCKNASDGIVAQDGMEERNVEFFHLPPCRFA